MVELAYLMGKRALFGRHRSGGYPSSPTFLPVRREKGDRRDARFQMVGETKTPTAACAAIGASSCCLSGPRQIALPVPHIRAFRQLLDGVPTLTRPGRTGIGGTAGEIAVASRTKTPKGRSGSDRSPLLAVRSAWLPVLLRLPIRLREPCCLS